MVLALQQQFAHAQLAKKNRAVAQLTVEPAVAVEGRTFAIHAQIYQPQEALQLRIVSVGGECLHQEPIEARRRHFSTSWTAPEKAGARFQVWVEARQGAQRMVVAHREVCMMPKYLARLQAVREQIESIDQQSEDKARLQRSGWALLAALDDLSERAKTATLDRVFDLNRRLHALEAKARSLAAGRDPFAGHTGYQLRGYRSMLDRSIQPYSLYVPREYDPERAWPLVIMLHGAWSNHHLALRRVFGQSNRPGEADADAKRQMPSLPDVPYLVAAPNAYETFPYEGFAEQDVWRVLDEVKGLFHVDEDRIYLTGLSMGGAGAMKLAFRRPDVFAAIAPVCGKHGAELEASNRPSFVRRLEYAASAYAVAENARHLPVSLMHGAKDAIVKAKNSTQMHERLQQLGYQSQLEIYPDVEHAAWENAYADARIFDWFAHHRRNPHPRTVVYRTGDARGGGAYWVRIVKSQRIREVSGIRAEAGKRGVSLQTENVAALLLECPPELFLDRQEIEVEIDGQACGVMARCHQGFCAGFVCRQGQWLRENPFASCVSETVLPGRLGLHELFVLRHQYAYASAGDADENRLAERLASQRSIHGSDRDVQWPVIEETALMAAPTTVNHTMLFGAAGGSAFLLKYMDSLPIEWTNGALRFCGRAIAPEEGLLFIYPHPLDQKAYLVVGTACGSKGLASLSSFASELLPIHFLMPDFTVWGPDGKPRWGGLFNQDWQIDESGNYPVPG